MGKTGIQKDKSGKEVKLYLTKCNGCEKDVRLSSVYDIKPEQIDELQERMLCSNCLNKKVGAKK